DHRRDRQPRARGRPRGRAVAGRRAPDHRRLSVRGARHDEPRRPGQGRAVGRWPVVAAAARRPLMPPVTMVTLSADGYADFTLPYNPTELAFEKAMQFAEIAIPGLDAPLQQFVRGQAEKLTIKRFFESPEQG